MLFYPRLKCHSDCEVLIGNYNFSSAVFLSNVTSNSFMVLEVKEEELKRHAKNN